MIVYVNGDSHSAGAEAVNPHVFAMDDPIYWGLGKEPHPDNERASYGCELANWLNAILFCDAESAGSNTRIMRTTRDWIAHNAINLPDTLIVIQWSTWEREEWQDEDGTYYQVNASGIDDVPESMQLKYKKYVIDVDWDSCTRYWHDEIWEFHKELKEAGIRHVFFNGNNHFGNIEHRHHWGKNYIGPYDPDKTYDSVLRENGFKPVNPNSWHFGPDAHCFWGEYLLQYITKNELIGPDEIPTY